MHHEPDHTDELDDILGCARAAEDALRRLVRLTIQRSSMTPAAIDVVLAQLAGAIAALPQAVAQLGDMLENSSEDFDLAMDAMVDVDDPADAIAIARLHLDAIREPAVEVHRHLDAAHQLTAHIAADDHLDDVAENMTSVVRRHEDREPPPMRNSGERPPGRRR